MGSKSSKNVQQLKCSKTLDSEGTTMSIEMENTQMEKENTRNKTLAIEEESEESSPEYSEELESRASSGIESEISQEDSGEEEEMDQENVPEEEESLEEELRSDRTVEDEEIQNYEIDSIREELSYQMDLNPDPSNSIDNQLDEQADVESLYSQPSSQVEEDERIVCGADTMEYDRLQNILSNEFLQENNISFGENSFELEEEQKSPYLDDYSSIEFSTSSYPIEKEYRQNGMIVFHVKRPFANEIQSFWTMVLEKRIPTIEICCDFIEDGILKRVPYFPIQGESEIKCGTITIKRLGTERQLSMNLRRQQLLIYEMNGNKLEYKHSVTLFNEIRNENSDSVLTEINKRIVEKHVSHQPNPQFLIIGSI